MREPGRLLMRGGALVALLFSAASAVDTYVVARTFCAPGGECEALRHTAAGALLAPWLPGLGLFAFTLVFTASLVDKRGPLRFGAWLAIAAGLGGAGLIAVQLVEARLCPICLGVDSAAIVAAIGGGVALGRGEGAPEGSARIAHWQWGLYTLAIGAPFTWAAAAPPRPAPEAVRELWRESGVTVVEVVDFGCAYCRRVHPLVSEALERAEGEVHFERVVVSSSFSRDAALGHHCAGEQGAAETMADRLFASGIERHEVRSYARALELDLERFDACLESTRAAEALEANVERAGRMHLRGLPTVFVGDRELVGADEASGASRYLSAIAQGREPPRPLLWPFFMLIVAALAGGATGLFLQLSRDPDERSE